VSGCWPSISRIAASSGADRRSSNAFDASGAPTQAATAFAQIAVWRWRSSSGSPRRKARGCNSAVLERGAATAALLPDLINQAIAALPIARRMRWGTRSAEFVRPVHGVVLMYGDDVVPATVLGLSSGASPAAIASIAPKPITLKSAPGLREAACEREGDRADFDAPRGLIRAGVPRRPPRPAATRLDRDALLDEVTALVEWPVPIAGRFEPRFLELPREVVIATIQDHQRYFASRAPRGADRRVHHGEQHRKPRPGEGARRQRARGAPAA
jgi:glycyl-tRNA synthetase beta chain